MIFYQLSIQIIHLIRERIPEFPCFVINRAFPFPFSIRPAGPRGKSTGSEKLFPLSIYHILFVIHTVRQNPVFEKQLCGSLPFTIYKGRFFRKSSVKMVPFPNTLLLSLRIKTTLGVHITVFGEE